MSLKILEISGSLKIHIYDEILKKHDTECVRLKIVEIRSGQKTMRPFRKRTKWEEEREDEQD